MILLQNRGVLSSKCCLLVCRHSQALLSTLSHVSFLQHRPDTHSNVLYSSLNASRKFASHWSAATASAHIPNYGPKPLEGDDPLSPLKSPIIPDGHPIAPDGSPIGHFIPDYDVELPIRSHGGYAKDFEAWTEPPVFPPTAWPKIAVYDYEELVTTDLPRVYRINMGYLMTGMSAAFICISVVGTKWETKRYYDRVSRRWRPTTCISVTSVWRVLHEWMAVFPL